MRYVGGGKFDQTLDIANNDIAARVYVDVRAQVTVDRKLTLFADVDNLLDRQPPLLTYGSIFYDPVGRYVTVGAKVHF